MNINRWVFIAGALLLAAAVGFFAYNAGVENAAGHEPHSHHHFWGGGFFFFPLFFFGLLLVGRGRFWRRGWHHHGCRYEGPRENDSHRG